MTLAAHPAPHSEGTEPGCACHGAVDEDLRDCAPGTPLHALLLKAHGKGAARVHVGRNGKGADVRYWDRHWVDGVLQNGDFLPLGAREMMRALALTPPVALTHPGERLLYTLRAGLDGDLSVVVEAVIDDHPTWWHVGYDHTLERLVAEACPTPHRLSNPMLP